MSTGEKIKRRRLELKMSQEELAKKVGYSSRSTINKIEIGTRDFPRKMQTEFAKALNVPVEWLLIDLDYKDDEECIKNLGYLKPLEELPEDISALNVFLYNSGEHIIKVEGKYYLGECGQLTESDIDYLKESAETALRVSFEMLRKKKNL